MLFQHVPWGLLLCPEASHSLRKIPVTVIFTTVMAVLVTSQGRAGSNFLTPSDPDADKNRSFHSLFFIFLQRTSIAFVIIKKPKVTLKKETTRPVKNSSPEGKLQAWPRGTGTLWTLWQRIPGRERTEDRSLHPES